MDMIADGQQTFDGLVNHMKNAFQLDETVYKLISFFMVDIKRRMSQKMSSQMTSRFWWEKS